MKDEIQKQMRKDLIASMDSAYEELRLLLIPVMHNKIKYINGKLLKDCFKQITTIVEAHKYIRTQNS